MTMRSFPAIFNQAVWPTQRSKNAIAQDRHFCRWPRPQYALLSASCRARERRRYSAGSLRRVAQYDEKRPDTWSKRSFHAAGACHSPQLRHRFDGAVVGRPLLGKLERGAASADDRELWTLHLGDIR